MDGALLVNKHAGVSSFGVIELLKKATVRHGLKMGHGGTLDPFATGLLVVCIGRGVKLSRYFLGSIKSYEGTLVFGKTTVPGDPTEEISERSDRLPQSLEQLRAMAERFAAQPYLQTPPMHSAKKRDGKPLYELARQGIEVEREARLCRLLRFDFSDYSNPEARFSVTCSPGTYIRTLAQDFARLMGSVGMLRELHRTSSGSFSVKQAMTVDQITEALRAGTRWEDLPCHVRFDELLGGYPSAEATPDEALSLARGQQGALFSILQRVSNPGRPDRYLETENTVAIYSLGRLAAVARNENGVWGLERVFTG